MRLRLQQQRWQGKEDRSKSIGNLCGGGGKRNCCYSRCDVAVLHCSKVDAEVRGRREAGWR